ncbi:hypothetical protein MLD38_026132 [Melastoma candidum]|uniref:Uncharacterized protein n=1 Tax=Melastoma candidum TaxID=119954 RepID=A0ACB9NZ01_9MYRT|nr:hypothetical protein MLD38_026132 [Melastoma candidum]
MEVVVSIFLLFAGIYVLVLIHLCMVHGVSGEGGGVLIQRMSGGGDGPDPIPIKMSPKDIEMLPCFEFGGGDRRGIGKNLGQVNCAVCLERFAVGDVCRHLPGCGHCFHACCIDSWIAKTPACPVCRKRISTTSPMDYKVGVVGGDAAAARTLG